MRSSLHLQLMKATVLAQSSSYFIPSPGYLRYKDVYRCESGRCRSLRLFLTFLSVYFSRFSFYINIPLVPDISCCCDSEECTVLTRGVGVGRLVYILHKWRKAGLKFWLKEWDPDLPDGIEFIIRPLEGDNYYKLVIGAEDNEKVILYYSREGNHRTYFSNMQK